MKRADDRIKSILKEHREEIRIGLELWLYLYEFEEWELAWKVCPFRYMESNKQLGCEICSYFFPQRGTSCPCGSFAYSVDYVSNVGKYLLRLVKEAEK